MKQIILFVFFICSLPAQAQKTDTLTNAAIIEMIEFGFDESVIISKIRTSVAKFDTSIDSLKYMKSKGVSNAILAKIVEVVNSSNQKPEASDEETQLTDLSDRITKEETIFNGGGLYNPFKITAWKSNGTHPYVIGVMARDMTYRYITEFGYIVYGTPQEAYDVFKQIRDAVKILKRNESIQIPSVDARGRKTITMETVTALGKFMRLYSGNDMFELPIRHAENACEKILEYCKENNIELIE